MELSQNIKDAYSRQYAKDASEWRMVGAKAKAGNITELASGISFKHVLEVGSGEGSILSLLSKWGFSDNLNCVEISETGLERTRAKNIEHLRQAVLFDGYHIPFADDQFDLAICSHVLEHVEHERALLREIKRVSRYQIFEVPIDFSFHVDKKLKHYLSYGHLNIYTPALFRFLLMSENFQVEKDKHYMFSNEFLAHIYKDNKKGMLMMKLRRLLWNIFPFMKGIKPSSYAVLTSKNQEALSIF